MSSNPKYRIDIRLNRDQLALINAVAAFKGQSANQYVLESAMTRASEEFLDRTNFVLTDSQWEAFMDLLARPASPNVALEKLVQRPSSFSD